MSEHFTIPNAVESLLKVKGSKFIGLAYPVESAEDIKIRLEEVKRKYRDAQHHCYAWILGLNQPIERSYDDGEPSHSAGDPILGQIRSFKLTNVLVVVVRYFGGTKLGVGGLISAYKASAEEALAKVQVIQIFERIGVTFSFEYPQLSTVERLIEDFAIEVGERKFLETCKITGRIKKDDLDQFKVRTKDFFNIDITTSA